MINKQELQTLTEWACEARRRGYAAPTEAVIDRYLRLIERAHQLGVEARTITPSRDPRDEDDEWLTARGLDNEITSLLMRANNAGHNLAAEEREEKIAKCPDCNHARQTGNHENVRWVSHEEQQCRRCGAYYCVPDVD